jgi:hypothetical protein
LTARINGISPLSPRVHVPAIRDDFISVCLNNFRIKSCQILFSGNLTQLQEHFSLGDIYINKVYNFCVNVLTSGDAYKYMLLFIMSLNITAPKYTINSRFKGRGWGGGVGIRTRPRAGIRIRIRTLIRGELYLSPKFCGAKCQFVKYI